MSIEIFAKGCILLEAKLLFRLMVGSPNNLQSIEADKLALLEGEQELSDIGVKGELIWLRKRSLVLFNPLQEERRGIGRN